MSIAATHDLTDDKKVAVKIINTKTTSPNDLEKVKREVQIMKQLSHPHIVKLYFLFLFLLSFFLFYV